jgi:branched-chain amino acid transport system ATP-binding protein
MLLELHDLDVSYGAVQALHGVSLAVGDGEVVALVGANGAGKSTTLRTISGLLQPTRGAVTFDGASLLGLPAHEVAARGIGHSPEGRRVFAEMSVTENLELGAWRHRSGTQADLDRVYTLFPVLAQRRRQAAGTLSGGEQQMLAIGRALMGRPALLLLDEPSLGLAPLMVRQIFTIIDQINEQGTAVLLVEQNVNQALARSDRAYVLENGRVVLAGASEDVAGNQAIQEAYLGSSRSTSAAPATPASTPVPTPGPTPGSAPGSAPGRKPSS